MRHSPFRRASLKGEKKDLEGQSHSETELAASSEKFSVACPETEKKHQGASFKTHFCFCSVSEGERGPTKFCVKERIVVPTRHSLT